MDFPRIPIVYPLYRLVRRNLVILSVSLSFLLSNVLLLILLDYRFNAVKRDKLIEDPIFTEQFDDVQETAKVGILEATVEISVGGVKKAVPFMQLTAVDGNYVYGASSRPSEAASIPYEEVARQLEPQLVPVFERALQKGENVIRLVYLPCLTVRSDTDRRLGRQGQAAQAQHFREQFVLQELRKPGEVPLCGRQGLLRLYRLLLYVPDAEAGGMDAGSCRAVPDLRDHGDRVRGAYFYSDVAEALAPAETRRRGTGSNGKGEGIDRTHQAPLGRDRDGL
jgi:hypothetical protein